MAYTKNVWVDQNVQRPKTYEMTYNTDGSVTLTDSFGVVTEIGTPVNAVNMNHIENGIKANDTAITTINSKIPSNASSSNKMAVASDIAAINSKIPSNASSSNKMATQADLALKANLTDLDTKADITQLHALKSYLDAGELLTDAEGLADIQDYAHSTFDLSKFTVVGSPVITDDGIASGFSSSNYIKTISPDYSKPFEIHLRLKEFSGYSNAGNAIVNFFGYKDYRNSVSFETNNIKYRFVWSLCLEEGGSTSQTVQTDNIFDLEVDYDLILGWDGTEYYIKYKLPSEANYTKSTNNVTSSNPIKPSDKASSTISDRVFSIGYTDYNHYLNGSIDLKQFSITVDGVPVFSGNKTGLDVIKLNDYTVYGSPIITDDGIASGFSTSNYINSSISAITPQNELIVKSRVIYSTADNYAEDSKVIYDLYDGTNDWRLSVNRTGGNVFLSGNNKPSLGFGATHFNLTDGDVIESELKVTKTQFALTVSINGGTPETATAAYETVFYSISNILIGHNNTAGGTYHWTGSIDLNTFKVYVDGDLVYQPCLRIPYTESHSGSKIADAIYRNRVIDAYEQGYDYRYYTLSDTDFTLPMGEIYGDIENCLNVNTATQAEKNMVMGWGVPDYSLATSVSYSSGDAIGFNGYLAITGHWVNHTAFAYLYINNCLIMVQSSANDNGNSQNNHNSIMVEVSSTDVITWTNYTASNLAFSAIPYKGGN